MRAHVSNALGAFALIASVASVYAQTDPGVELAFMPSTLTVTLLNEGGKYVAIDLKHIPQGGTCRMDKDALIARVEPGASPGTTRVRYAAGQVSSGGCPFLTDRSARCRLHRSPRRVRPNEGRCVEESRTDQEGPR